MLISDSMYGVPKENDTAPISMFISDDARRQLAKFLETKKDTIWHQTLFKIPILAERYKLKDISEHEAGFTQMITEKIKSDETSNKVKLFSVVQKKGVAIMIAQLIKEGLTDSNDKVIIEHL